MYRTCERIAEMWLSSFLATPATSAAQLDAHQNPTGGSAEELAYSTDAVHCRCVEKSHL